MEQESKLLGEREEDPAENFGKGWISLVLGVTSVFLTLLVYVTNEQGKAPNTGGGPRMEGAVILIFLFWVAVLGLGGILSGRKSKRSPAGRIGLILSLAAYAGAVLFFFVDL